MSITEEFIQQKCMDGLEGTTHVECTVEASDCGGARVEVTVVNESFTGKPPLKRHRLVNEVFGAELKSNQIHALTIKAYTPVQWETKK
jgi:acid stress-induced BolA-like protein IbaG/YrbA